MNEQCVLHKEMLERVESQIKEIYDALMGTMKEPGFISQTNAKLKDYETFKSQITKAVTWTITSLLGCVIAAVVGVAFNMFKG